LLSTISSISEVPERIERIILTDEYSPEGIYAIAFCIDGIWIEVIVDDLIPCLNK